MRREPGLDQELEVLLLDTDSRSLPSLPNKKNKTNWVEKAGGLPSYINRIAKHLHSEKGMDTSRAIATAVNTVKRWCRGGGGVSEKTKALACKAVASWEAKKGASSVKASSEKERHLFYHGVWLSASDRDLIEVLLESDTASLRLDQEVDPGGMALALNAARRAHGLSLSTIVHFDPQRHPRDWKGHFRDVVDNLRPGHGVELPNGARVDATHSDFVVSTPDGHVDTVAKHEDAADNAMDHYLDGQMAYQDKHGHIRDGNTDRLLLPTEPHEADSPPQADDKGDWTDYETPDDVMDGLRDPGIPSVRARRHT